jgi:transporter family-2 protein
MRCTLLFFLFRKYQKTVTPNEMLLSSILIYATAILAGAFIPAQASINTKLSSVVQPIQASFISFVIGSLFLLLLIIVMRLPFPLLQAYRSLPFYAFSGGVFGAIFVTIMIFLIPKIGVMATLMSGLVGQMLMSAVIDHFGWFGVPVQPITLSRSLGFVLLFAGVFMVKK